MAKRTCSVEGCDRPLLARGYCPKHYRHARLAGEFPTATCTLDGCDGPVTGRGLCSKHWQRWRYKNPEMSSLGTGELCSIPGCHRLLRSRGWCHTHWMRWKRMGDPGPADILTPRPAGSGWIDDNGYRRYTRNGKSVTEHRLVMEHILGRPLQPGETVHHINGDKLDNRPENLQLRQGNHGKGAKFVCLDCGSHNIQAATL